MRKLNMKEIKVSTKIDTIKKQNFWSLKNAIIELKCLLQVCNMSFKQAEYRISELEDRSFEILNYEEKKNEEK